MASRLFNGALVAVTTLLLSPVAQAFFPFITDDTGTQGKGASQVELNYEFVKAHSDELDLNGRVLGTGTETANTLASGYTYGVSDQVDIFVGIARQTSPISGWLNNEVGAKWVLAGDQISGWSTAVKPTLVLPVTKQMQDKGLGTAKTNLGLSWVASFVADTHELHLNLDYASNQYASTEEEQDQRKSLWRVSAAPVYVLNPAWKVGLDVGLQTNPDYNSRYQVFGEIGLQYAAADNLQFGLGILGSTALHASPNGWDMAITAGVAYQF
jgi:hypothetical protein